MQITIDQSALARELALVAGASDKRGTMPILSTVRMVAAGDALSLTCTDLECGVTARVPATVKAEGAICLPVTRSLDLIRALPSGDVSITVDDKQYATIRAGRSRTRIPGMSLESFPELPAAPEATASVDAGALSRQFARVKFAISQEESRFTLNGALMVIEGSLVRLVATDGHRLAHTEADCATASAPIKALFPRKAIAQYAKLADVACGARAEIATDDNHIFLTVGERTMVARKLTGNFPDYVRVLPAIGAPGINVDRAEFKAALERVAQFSDERSRAVRFTFRAGEVGLAAQSMEVGEAEESVACNGTAEMEIGINGAYVLDFLNAAGGSRVQVIPRDAKSAVEMRPMRGAGTEQDPYAESTDYRVVVMPMRI